MHIGSKCFGCFLNGQIIGFIAILNDCGREKTKRVHRLVIHPHYQGIGIGYRFLEFIGTYYLKQGYKFKIITSNPALKYHLLQCPLWKIKNKMFQRRQEKYQIDQMRRIISFEMIKPIEENENFIFSFDFKS